MENTDNQPGQIHFWQRAVRFEPGDSQRSLFEIVNDLRNKVIQVPAFQREFVWKDEKRRAFVNRLIDNRKPIGVISTYEIEKDDQRIVYLNDGLQRLSTCAELLTDPTKYGLSSQDDAIALLRSYSFSVQHRRYADHDMALQDYKDINQGTPLTAFEFYKGDITNIPNYDLVWKSRIERLNAIVDAAVIRCGASVSSQRGDKHQYLRHNLALFYRLMTEDKQTSDYRLGSTLNRGKGIVVEQRFRTMLAAVALESVDQRLRLLEGILNSVSADVLDIWSKPENRGLSIHAKLLRWFFDVAIWRKNNGNIPVDVWQDFLRRVITATEGRSVVSDPSGTNLIRLAELSRLRAVCAAVGSSMYEYEPPKRTQRRPVNAMPGYDMSHIEPFSKVGEGPTVMEPASINRARGNRSGVPA